MLTDRVIIILLQRIEKYDSIRSYKQCYSEQIVSSIILYMCHVFALTYIHFISIQFIMLIDLIYIDFAYALVGSVSTIIQYPMLSQEISKSRPTIFRKFPRRRNYSSKPQRNPNDKYMLEGETRQIGQIVTIKNVRSDTLQRNSNTSIVTFQFSDIPTDPFAQKMSFPTKLDFSKKRNANRESYTNSIRPLTSNMHISSMRVASCEVRKLQNEICNRKSVKKSMGRLLQKASQDCGLNVQGQKPALQSFESTTFFSKNSVCSQRGANKMRMTAGSFRVKSQQNSLNNEFCTYSNSVELVDFLRKPVIKKDHFVFSMSDKIDTPDNRAELFRDFLWKLNYSNGLFVITPTDSSAVYKAYVGKGNNSLMIKGILKRRNWWTICENQSEANFVWTQLKVNNYFELQNARKMPLQLKDLYSQKELCQIDKQYNTDFMNEAEGYTKIFNRIDIKNWYQHCLRNSKTQQKICSSTYVKRVGLLNKKRLLKLQNPFLLKSQNHLIQNYYIGNKKALFYNLKKYYEYINKSVFDIVPLTFHITKGVQDPKYQQFLAAYKKIQNEKKIDRQLKNVWIMKPGENTNRGNGISVCFGLEQIQSRLKSREKNKDGSLRTFILQKYMQKPLLYQGRKFDIRHYMLISCIAGSMKAYWYQEGYVRTSSSNFSLKNNKDLYVHLTNDAVQKNCQTYGKYESGNKLSYLQLDKYITKVSKKQDKSKSINFFQQLLPKMRSIAADAVRSTYHLLDKQRKHHNFQLLGLDFMIDDQYVPYLIEVNTNPCLELSCPLLEAIIPNLIENTLRICVDPLFPPPENVQIIKKNAFNCENPIQQNKFQLIFDELIEKQQLNRLFQGRDKMDVELGKIQQDDTEFQNDGEQIWDNAKPSQEK